MNDIDGGTYRKQAIIKRWRIDNIYILEDKPAAGRSIALFEIEVRRPMTPTIQSIENEYIWSSIKPGRITLL